MPRFGNVPYQISWIKSLILFVAGFHLFSAFSGDFERLLSDTFVRIILNFRLVTSFIWRNVGEILNISLYGFEDRLTFTFLILFPFILFYRKMKLGGMFEDENKILAILNFFSFMFVSNVFSRDVFAYNISLTEASFEFLPIVFSVLLLAIYYSYLDFNYKRLIKISFILFSAILFFYLLYFIFLNYNEFLSIPNFGVWVFVSLLSNFAYCVALFFRIDGYYPLLVCCVVFCFYYVVDWVLLNAPILDNFLTGIGA